MKIRLFALMICFVAYHGAKAQQDTGKNALQLSELSLDELLNMQVVTASGFLQTTSEAPSTIIIITAQQIAQRGYEQLEDALRDVPGIDMIHLNGYAPTLIYFRGMYGAENLRALLMIDGIVENNIIGSNDMAGPAYSLHNVERIEIVWGPASALYGADAFGGVINIITKKGGDINGLHAEKGSGSFNTSFEKFSLGFKNSKYEYDVAGTLYSTDGPTFTNRDPLYSNSYVDKATSLLGTFSCYVDKSKITLGFRSYDTPMGWGTFLNSPTVLLGLPPQGYDNKDTIGIVERNIRGERPGLEEPYSRTFFAQEEYKPNEKFNLLSRVVYRETGLADDSYAYLTVDSKKLYRIIVANSSNQVSGELAANYSLAQKHLFSAGIQFYQDNVEKVARNSQSPVISRSATFDTTVYLLDGRDTLGDLNAVFKTRQYDIRNNFGSYLQYVLNTNLLGKTSFTAGVRYDYNSYFGSTASPRLVIVNQYNNNFTFKLQFGKAFRAPTNDEIYQAPPNIPLKTEKIITYEFNVIYTQLKNTRIQLNAYRNQLTDVIFISNLSGLAVNKNPGKLNVNGLEGSCDVAFSKIISGFLNITLNNTEVENTLNGVKRNVPGIAGVKGNAGVTMHVADLFSVSISGNMVGKRPVPSTDPYGPVGGYFLTDCVISTAKLYNHITASFNVQNLFNTKWLDPGFRQADGSVYSTVLEQPGRTGLFKITYDL